MKKGRLLLLFLIVSTLIARAEEYNLEQLDELLRQKVITKDDYEILKKDIVGEKVNSEGYYNLKVNGYLVTNAYTAFYDGNILYLNVDDFVQLLNIPMEDNGSIKRFKIGENQTLVTIDYKKNKISKGNEKIEITGNSIRVRDGKAYLSQECFKNIFLTYFETDDIALKMEMYLGFSTPQDILEDLESKQVRLENKQKENELLFIGKRELFDLGYLRVNMGYSFTRTRENKKYEKDWSGSLDYQGPLLYGEFRTSYNLKDDSLGSITLKYADVWKNHTFEYTSSSGGDGGKNFGARPNGFRFYKDRGYIESETGLRIVQSVPLGSKVELVYMGTPVAIADEKDGQVVFESQVIKTDRTYELRVYPPNGEFYTKIIKTTEDYDRQRKHEYSYDLALEEKKTAGGRYGFRGSMYYGFTENLTFGLGFTREPTAFRNSSVSHNELSGLKEEDYYKYTHDISGDIVYGGVINSLSYTFKFGATKSLDDYRVESGSSYGRTYKDKHTFDTTLDMRYDKWKAVLTQIDNGKFYDNKRENTLKLSYELFRGLNVDYNYSLKRMYENYVKNGKTRTKTESMGVTYDYYLGPVLLSASGAFDLHNSMNNNYSLSAYYNGWKSMAVRLENRWTNAGKDYETVLSLYNNNFADIFDFSTELRYTDKKEKLITFKFGVDISDWVDIGFNADNKGNRKVDVAVDKVFDLRNPKIDTTGGNVSRIYVTTFIDANNNNVYDKDEELLEGVEVAIGKEAITTDKKGRAVFYGMGNGILFDITPTIKKPHFALGNNKIKAISKYTSNVEVFIPIKPMIDIAGYVEFDDDLKLTDDEKEAFYSDVLVEIRDKEGNSLELVAPDNTGHFDVSGLIPEDYQLEVYYLGTKYKIPNMKRDFTLSYNPKGKSGFNYNIALKVYDKEFKLLTKN